MEVLYIVRNSAKLLIKSKIGFVLYVWQLIN